MSIQDSTLPRGSRARWATAAFAVYAAAIIGSNYLIVHVGIPAGPGTHLTPVGFGLLAPRGVWAAAVSFPARDVVQRTGGRWLGIAAILIGAAVSWKVSDPHIAMASGPDLPVLGVGGLRGLHAAAAPLVRARSHRLRMRGPGRGLGRVPAPGWPVLHCCR